MINSNYLIIISAPSGAGKTTLCHRLLQDFPGLLIHSISSTTRPPRKNELNGREYNFLSKEEFEKKIEKNEFAEWAQVHGHHYGTTKENISHAFKEGKSVLLDIDVQGAESLRRAFPNQNYSIFIAPPNLTELENRLTKRATDSQDVIKKRIQNAKSEMNRINEFDEIIINDDLDSAYNKLKKIIQKLIVKNE